MKMLAAKTNDRYAQSGERETTTLTYQTMNDSRLILAEYLRLLWLQSKSTNCKVVAIRVKKIVPIEWSLCVVRQPLRLECLC